MIQRSIRFLAVLAALVSPLATSAQVILDSGVPLSGLSKLEFAVLGAPCGEECETIKKRGMRLLAAQGIEVIPQNSDRSSASPKLFVVLFPETVQLLLGERVTFENGHVGFAFVWQRHDMRNDAASTAQALLADFVASWSEANR